MNTLCQKITVGLGLALSLSLASCEKDSLLSPNPLNGAREGFVNDEPLPSPKLPQTPRLTKYGNSTLMYSNDGRLQKVTTFVNRGGVNYHTDYTYAVGSIRAASYQGTYLTRDETFTIGVDGRCTESVVKINNVETSWVYSYNAKGQLWSCQNKNGTVGGTTYSYDADGDLANATVTTSSLGVMHMSFSYVVPPMDNNYFYETYPLNINAPLLPEHDTFLPIFGKTGKYLVKHIAYFPAGSSIVPTPSDRFYSYVIPADGYVTERDMAYTFGGSSVEKIHYAYELADVLLK